MNWFADKLVITTYHLPGIGDLAVIALCWVTPYRLLELPSLSVSVGMRPLAVRTYNREVASQPDEQNESKNNSLYCWLASTVTTYTCVAPAARSAE